MTERDPVPLYIEIDGASDLPAALQALSSQNDLAIPLLRYPVRPRGAAVSSTFGLEQDIIKAFFDAIRNKQSEVVAMMIENNLVTPNTTDQLDQTPVIVAIAAGNVRMVQELVDFGADVDEWGKNVVNNPRAERTPLMVAAELGNLNLVKLFVDVFKADDALVAPDGQLALRLAAEKGHREVVTFLPMRRGGGWRRWKTHHTVAVERAKKAVRKIYRFFRILLWDIPRLLLWELPKWAIFVPLKKGTVYCWKNRAGFGPWCKRKATEAATCAWKEIKAIPKTLADSAREIWKFTTKTLPTALKKLVKYLWSLITVKLPFALKTVAQWLWQGAKTVGNAIWSVVLSIVSLLHTVVSSILSFFRELTLKDIWNGFCEVLLAIFVEFPTNLWSWTKKFGEVSYQVMKKLGGEIGQILWNMGYGILWVMIYVPRQMFKVVSSLGGSLVKGWHELLVWVNPKR